MDCTELSSLTLSGNEIALGSTYRYEVLSVLKQLQYLDDLPVSRSERSRKRSVTSDIISPTTQNTLSIENVTEKLVRMKVDVE